MTLAVALALLVLVGFTPSILSSIDRDDALGSFEALEFSEPLHTDEGDNTYHALTALEGYEFALGTGTEDLDLDNYEEAKPFLDELLSLNQSALALYKAATQKPYYWDPRIMTEADADINMQLLPLSLIRNLARLEIRHAYALFEEGRVNESIDIVLRNYRFGSALVNGRSTLIDTLVGLAIRDMALGTIEEMLSARGFTEYHKDRIFRGIEASPISYATFGETMKAEFWMFHNVSDPFPTHLTFYYKPNQLRNKLAAVQDWAVSNNGGVNEDCSIADPPSNLKRDVLFPQRWIDEAYLEKHWFSAVGEAEDDDALVRAHHKAMYAHLVRRDALTDFIGGVIHGQLHPAYARACKSMQKEREVRGELSM